MRACGTAVVEAAKSDILPHAGVGYGEKGPEQFIRSELWDPNSLM